MVDQADQNSIQYLSILLNDVEQTKNYLAAYNNLILSIQSAHPTQDPNELATQMKQEEKQLLAQTVAYLRSYSTRAYINFKSISNKFTGKQKEERVKKIEELYKQLKTNLMPEYDIAEEFVLEINTLFVEEINVQSLLNTKQKLSTLASVGNTPSV